MTDDHAEVVRRTIDLFNRREIERALDVASDDFEMDWSESIGPIRGIYRGREQVLELWNGFLEAWDEVRWEVQELIPVDDTQVIVVNPVRMRGGHSGAEVEATAAQLWRIEDGRVRSVKLFQSRVEALAAAALAG